MNDENLEDLGPCCACGTADPARMIRNLLMLPLRAPVANTGWGCFVCRLPLDGTLAVVCDACLESNAEIVEVILGMPSERRRLPRSALPLLRFEHNRSNHADEPWPAVEDLGEIDEDVGELGYYTCQRCGAVEERPPVVIFAGEGEAMTATELCGRCVNELFTRRERYPQ